MLKSKSFLAVDFGAGSLKLAEFEVNDAGGLRLRQYGLKSLGAEGAQETTREQTILKALQELISECGVKAKDVNVCAPGFHVFSKFVKLPPVDAGKVTQIIQYEAQQNVPFPLQEVVWDYQIMGSSAGGELEVLLVAIKADIVEGLFRVTDAAKLRLNLADVSPAALCNAFRYNYGDLEDCTMLLDIGAKTSNLLFFEKGKVYSRSINLGANSITQDFANEAKLKFDAAEKTKISEGFVSLGGAYEEPENPHQAAISKIARQFMTRLHIQVNQTMQFYRGQQGGSAPQRLFLSGGASVMPYTAQFFAEKLNVPVEYFNPFRNVQIDPSVNLEDLARVAHSLGEVVGLGLRNLAHCPVELNLIPETTRRWQTFNEKKPYLIFSVFSLVAVVGAMGLLYQKLADVKQQEFDVVTQRLEPLRAKHAEFQGAYEKLKRSQGELVQLTGWIDARTYWADVLGELRRVFILTERISGDKLKAETGVWIEHFLTIAATKTTSSLVPEEGGPGGAPTEPVPVVAAATPNQVSWITLVCRSVSRQEIMPDANTTIIYTLENQLKASPMFDPTRTGLTGNVASDEGTFSFSLVILLKHPLKL
ncbi:MAG TPA: type IV pilus assembly protein PilM [Verrucomicrobiae bacterium]|nr:type IV pilus assembly protein PilM [Verrucomicrobiae bacterium]